MMSWEEKQAEQQKAGVGFILDEFNDFFLEYGIEAQAELLAALAQAHERQKALDAKSVEHLDAIWERLGAKYGHLLLNRPNAKVL